MTLRGTFSTAQLRVMHVQAEGAEPSRLKAAILLHKPPRCLKLYIHILLNGETSRKSYLFTDEQGAELSP